MQNVEFSKNWGNNMLYFIKRGGEIQGPVSHEQLMRMVKHKQLKNTDLIGNAQRGYFQPLVSAWKQVKAGQPIKQKKRLKIPFLAANRSPNGGAKNNKKSETFVNNQEAIFDRLDSHSSPEGEAISWQMHLFIAACILAFGLHPLFVALLGAATGAICGIEFNLHSQAEGGVGELVQGMLLYHWIAFATIPLMLPLFIIQGVVALIQAPLYR